jgi:hypothetical protein
MVNTRPSRAFPSTIIFGFRKLLLALLHSGSSRLLIFAQCYHCTVSATMHVPPALSLDFVCMAGLFPTWSYVAVVCYSTTPILLRVTLTAFVQRLSLSRLSAFVSRTWQANCNAFILRILVYFPNFCKMRIVRDSCCKFFQISTTVADTWRASFNGPMLSIGPFRFSWLRPQIFEYF